MKDVQPSLLAAVHDDFAYLKRGVGLTPAKMREAQAVLAAMGEVEPILATQRLLDDLADMTGDDGLALACALRADPSVYAAKGLDGRRLASGVPENTAKGRERRAVEQLVAKWAGKHRDWASSVFTVHIGALPGTARIRFGGLCVTLDVFVDVESRIPVIRLQSSNRSAASDFLTIASDAKSGQAIAVYGTSGLSWRVELRMPAFASDRVRVHRDHGESDPVRVQVEATGSDGISTVEKIPGANLRGRTDFSIPTAALAVPCPITWFWTGLQPDLRPRIVYAEDELTP